MTVRDYDVEVSANGTSGWTAVSDVVSIDARIGQNYLLEPIQASTCTVVARYPSGFATPNTLFLIGNYLRVTDPVSGRMLWRGRVSDTRVDWGIPYAGGVGQADQVTVSAEGALADAGRTNIKFSASTKDFEEMADDVTGRGIPTTIVYNQSRDFSRPLVDGEGLSVLQAMQATYQMIVHDGGGSIVMYAMDQVRINTVNFSDTTNNATNQVFDLFGFDSLAENYYTQAIITKQGGTPYTSEQQTGASPYYTYSTETYNASNADTDSLGQAIVQIYSNRGFDVNQVSCQSAAQASWALDLGRPWWETPGTVSTVTFRGSTYTVLVIGGTFNATPEGSRFTYNLAPRTYRNYLVLNDSTFGKLDENRLGF